MKLPLLPKPEITKHHIYTFASGEKLYQIDISDVTKLQKRYYQNIAESTRLLMTYGAEKHTFLAILDRLTELNKLRFESQNNTVDIGLETQVIIDSLRANVTDAVPAEESQMQAMFDMYYVLEGEPELEMSDYWNRKKKELLDKDYDAKMFFFAKVQKTMNKSSSILEGDILGALKTAMGVN